MLLKQLCIRQFDLRWDHSKYYAICLNISRLSTSHLGIRANTGWLVRKGVLRSLKLKDRQYNRQNKNDKAKMVNKILKIEQHGPH